jgi:hypothetical protein
MVRFASALALTLLLVPAARAQETYDLRALINRDDVVGQRVRHVKTEEGLMEQVVTNNGRVAQQRKEEKRPTCTYVDHVEAVGQDGEPDRRTRTFEAFTDDRGQAVDVTGVVVTLTRTTGPDGKHDYAFAPAEGSKPLPEAVRADIAEDLENKRERESRGHTDETFNEALLPAEPQAAGATWPLDMAALSAIFGMEPTDLDLQQSQGTGTLEGVEERDGQTFVKIKLAMTFVVVSMRGQQLPPTPMNFVMTFTVSPTSNDGELTMQQRFEVSMSPQGAPPGMQVNVKVNNDRRETRESLD